jgi:hypothetical protein
MADSQVDMFAIPQEVGLRALVPQHVAKTDRGQGCEPKPVKEIEEKIDRSDGQCHCASPLSLHPEVKWLVHEQATTKKSA